MLTESAGTMVSEMDLVPLFCVGVALSAACTVTVEVPAVVGVPLITPEVDNVRPAGKVPVVTVQVYGAVPPIAVNVRGE